MISLTDANAYLDQALGISLPEFLVRAAMDRVEAQEPAMFAAGYSEAEITLVQAMAVAIVAAAGSPRRVASQSGASGAGRSFKHDDAALSSLRRALAAADRANTVGNIIGPDPKIGTLLMTV